jgi:hypothetical protein
MEVVWYLDRAAGLIAYPALYAAVLTGVFYNCERFGPLNEIAKRVHVEVSVFALAVTLGHGLLGVVDTWLVATGRAPEPAYGTTYLLAGVGVGVGAGLLLVVSVLGFLDARRFDRPWGPRVVHTFAYAGFVFGTVHAAAVGTDLVGLIRPLLGTTVAFVAYLLVLRLAVRVRGVPAGSQ